MFHARARFDVARGKASKDRHGNMVLEAPQKQVYVRCANCDKVGAHLFSMTTMYINGCDRAFHTVQREKDSLKSTLNPWLAVISKCLQSREADQRFVMVLDFHGLPDTDQLKHSSPSALIAKNPFRDVQYASFTLGLYTTSLGPTKRMSMLRRITIGGSTFVSLAIMGCTRVMQRSGLRIIESVLCRSVIVRVRCDE